MHISFLEDKFILVLLVLLYCCTEIFSFKSFAHELTGYPTSIDCVWTHDGERYWKEGFHSQTTISFQDHSAVVELLQRPDGTYPQKGYYQSQELSAGFLFSEVLPSWNIQVPSGTGYAIQMQVKGDAGRWSSWYYLGGEKLVWGLPFKKITNDTFGTVNIDHWVSRNAAKGIKYRIWFFSIDGKNTPYLKRFFISLRGYDKFNPRKKDRENIKTTEYNQRPKEIKIKVPFRSQMLLGNKLQGVASCPASIAMVLEYFNTDEDTTSVANLCYDNNTKIYGIWPRAAQVLSRYGNISYVKQYSSLDEARRTLADNIPIIASIKCKEGELPEAPYSSIQEHILVIAGFEGNESFYVNDPAASDAKNGYHVKYSAQGLQKTWIDNGGIGIVTYPGEKSRKGR